MEVTIGFSGQNQAIYVLDALSPVVNLGGKTITAILEVNGGWNSDSGQIYGQIFLEQGSVAGDGVASAQLLSPGTGLWSASTSTPTSSGCVTFTMTLPATGPLSTNGNYSVYSGPFDPSQVQYIGLKVGTGGGGSGFQQTILDIKSWTFQ
jgi:hypothetical protein